MTKKIVKSSLFVDLDGTFIKTDMLFESLVLAIKKNPLNIFYCIYWLMKGRSYLKQELAHISHINVSILPLNPEFYSFLISQKDIGRTIILATASNEIYAKRFIESHPIFDSYISSDEQVNLKGKSKLHKIQAIAETFSYAGNSKEDYIIFEQSDESYLVNPTKAAKKLIGSVSFKQVFDNEAKKTIVWLKQLRIHQWVKNILIFVPLLVSGAFLDVNAILATLYGFISFSLLASATYIINDLLDLEADRLHSRKKNRPLAAGDITIISAVIVAILMLIVSVIIALFIGGSFIYVLISYLLLTLMYSFVVKQYVGMDVISLASLFTIRIIAGSAILGVVLSFWLLSFSMFIFFSLALIKRCAELKSFETQNKTHASGRDYNIGDYPVLMSLGTSSAMLSVLMFCFYVNNNVLSSQYQEPTLLWLIVPALGYWLTRMWVKTNRGEMLDDPIVYALKDKGSLITMALVVATALLAQML